MIQYEKQLSTVHVNQNRRAAKWRKALLRNVEEKVNSDSKNEFVNYMKSWCLKCVRPVNYERLGNWG